jgi:hypothetical protein
MSGTEVAVKRSSKIALGSIGLWLLGAIALRSILLMSGSMYPMLDATTPNLYYNPDLHKFIAYLGYGWMVLCAFIAYLWYRATGND